MNSLPWLLHCFNPKASLVIAPQERSKTRDICKSSREELSAVESQCFDLTKASAAESLRSANEPVLADHQRVLHIQTWNWIWIWSSLGIVCRWDWRPGRKQDSLNICASIPFIKGVLIPTFDLHHGCLSCWHRRRGERLIHQGFPYVAPGCQCETSWSVGVAYDSIP